MRQDAFRFLPQFKLFIVGNHKPGLQNVDEAIRRRMNMIPFLVVIPKKERDLNLDEKLKEEWPGILAWMIEGCLEWQRIGLAPPKKVTDATSEYLQDEDVFGRFVDECCYVDRGRWTSFTALFHEWKQWTFQNNHSAGSSKKFSAKLVGAGFAKERRTEHGFIGIRLTEKEGGAEHKWSPTM